MKYLLALLLLLLLSCESFESVGKQVQSPKTIYKRDAYICVNGRCGTGMVLAQVADKYEITVKVDAKVDKLTFISCHRELILSDRTREFAFTYIPVKGLEAEPMNPNPCPVEIGAYDKEGRHAYGFIDFSTPGLSLPFDLKCNGYVTSSVGGVGICQGLKGLVQEMSFKYPTQFIVESEDCKIPIPNDYKTYVFPIRRGHCQYSFCESKAGFARCGRMTVIGYEQIAIRD